MPTEVEVIRLEIDATNLFVQNIGSRWDKLCEKADVSYRRLLEALDIYESS